MIHRFQAAVLAVFLAFAAPATAHRNAGAPLQAVVSLTACWDSTDDAVLQRYERERVRVPCRAVGGPHWGRVP